MCIDKSYRYQFCHYRVGAYGSCRGEEVFILLLNGNYDKKLVHARNQ